MIVTIYKNIRNTSTGFARNAPVILERIRTGESKKLIDQIRRQKDKQKRQQLKKELPSICWSGWFENRTDKGLKQHSGLMCLDFDGFEDDDTLQTWKDTLQDDVHTYALFVSPSGNGLKVLFKIPECNKEDHKKYFDAIGEKYDSKYFDQACSNISRVCYESHDPDLYINEDSDVWTKKAEAAALEFGNDTPTLLLKNTNQIIQNLMSWFNKNYDMSTGNRNQNMFKLAAAFSDYGVSMSEAEGVCLQFEKKDFNESEILDCIKSAYRRGAANFNSKYFEDTKTYEKIELKIKEGVSIKDITKTFPDHKNDEIEDAIHSIQKIAASSTFWVTNQNGNLKLKPIALKQFLEQSGFGKYFPSGSETPIFIKMQSNIVEHTSAQRIKDFILNYLLKNVHEFGHKPYDYFAMNLKYTKDDFLSLLDTIDISFNKDNQYECFLYYQNCALKIDRHDIKVIDYLDLNGYVWKEQQIERNFEKVDHHDAVYRSFIWKIAGEEVGNYDCIKSVIGYLCHSWKNSGNNKAIIMNDRVISENPNGGSGKGLFSAAIGKIKRMAVIDGKSFDPNKTFAYQTVSVDTQVLCYDDVKKNFNFELLFSVITEGITLEKKNKDAIKIPVEDSPKILVNTNFTIGGVGGSHERRKFEVELSAYFNVNHTPFEEFGHMLFDGWDDDQWNKFDSYMIQCIQYYLAKGLVQYAHVNLKERKFIKDTCFEFYEWAVMDNSIEFGIRHYNKDMFDKFLSENPDFKTWNLSQRRFTKWIDLYALYIGITPEKKKTQGNRWFMFSKKDNQQEDVDNDLQENEELLPF